MSAQNHETSKSEDCKDAVCYTVSESPVVDDEVVYLNHGQREELSKRCQEIQNETVKCWDKVVGHKVDLVEICTPWDSPLGKAVEERGGTVFRMGPHNGYDLTTRSGLVKACATLRELRPRNLHASPPCFPFSQFQNLNQRTEEQRESLAEKRVEGRKILKAIKRLAEIQFHEIPGDFSGEQPWKATSWEEKPCDG